MTVLAWLENDYNFELLLIMLLGGAFGGYLNYLRTGASDAAGTTWIARVLLGIGAALLVPLFLNTISSDILEASRTNSLKLFEFAGFCILAGISSRIFIDTLTSKVLK